jgi:hypothetical protein
MAKQTWTITGQIRVNEDESTGVATIRNLKGIEVEVAGSTVSNSIGWNEWGTVRTGKAGKFTLKVSKNEKDRFIRVRVRFKDDDLAIKGPKGDVLDSNWHVVYKSSAKKSGPTIDIGRRTFEAGSAHDLGEEDYRRQAVAWYLCRTTIDTLVDKDPYFAFKKKINVVYPATVISGVPYANGVDRTAYIHRGDRWWSAGTVLHEIMHLWNYDHNHGTANWLKAVCFDWNTHGHQEEPNIAFHEGFAQYAAEELLYHIWDRDKELPLNRKHLFDSGLRTLDMVERNDRGVISGLHVLTARGKLGPYKFVFGTASRAPENAGSQVGTDTTRLSGCPDAPKLSFWDVLRAFKAHPGAGWDTEWQVGKDDYGLIRFYDRCCDIYDSFDRSTRDRMLDWLDPSKTDEPREACEGLTERLTKKEDVVRPEISRKPARRVKRRR